MAGQSAIATVPAIDISKIGVADDGRSLNTSSEVGSIQCASSSSASTGASFAADCRRTMSNKRRVPP
jgi:hypothetical protein